MAHTHIIKDHDDHFIIDPITRKIKPETPVKNKLVRNDHKSERYTFEITRYIEGHDATQYDSVRIHYLNISSDGMTRSANIYEVDDIGVLENDSETAVFSWLISRSATTYSGLLSFAIEFRCISDDVVTYAWHTEIYSSISVSDVIDNNDTFIDEYIDIIEQWKNGLELVKSEQSLQSKEISDIKFEQILQNQEIARIKTTIGNGKRVFERVLFDYDGMWNIEDEARFAEVVDIYGQFETVVSGFGNRYDAEKSNGVVPMIKFLNALRAKYPNTKVFNYVELGNRAGKDQCFTEWMIKSYVNYTAHLGGELIEQEADGTRKYSGGISMDGVFFDECEYPFGVSRDRMNLAFTVAHENGLLAFPNCYSPEWSMFTDSTTATLPDGVTLANPNGVPVALADGDYFLLESCFSMPGSTSTIITDKTSWGRALNFSMTYRSKWPNLKMIPLNYISGETVKNTKLLQEVRSYCVLASYILGCDGCCMQVGTSYSPNLSNFEVPEIIKDSLTSSYPDIRTLTTNHYRIESNGHYFEYVMNISGADDNHIDFSKDFWDYVYFLVDGAKTTNIWLSVFSIYEEVNKIVDSVSMQYNDDPSLMQIVKKENQTGVSPYVARADHAHKTGPYIMIKKDEWDKTFHNYLSIKPYDQWTYNTSVDNKIITDTSLYVEGHKGDMCRMLLKAADYEVCGLLGKTLEIGADSLEVSENIKNTFEIKVTKYANKKWTDLAKIYVDTSNTSATFNESGLCARFKVPETVEEFEELYVDIRSRSSENYSYKINGFYIRDIDEKNVRKWYTNRLPIFAQWLPGGNGGVSITEINGDHSAKISFTGTQWTNIAPPKIVWNDVGIQKGKTVEIGVKATGANLSGLCFRIVSGGKNVANIDLGGSKYGEGIYNESAKYMSARYTIPEDQNEVTIKIEKTNSRLYDVEIVDIYLYDLSEEVIPEDEVFSNTELQIYRILDTVNEYQANTLYFLPNEIQLTDSLGNVTRYRSGAITNIGDIVTASNTLVAVPHTEEGDVYINKTTKEIFVLLSGVWTYLGKLAE